MIFDAPSISSCFALLMYNSVQPLFEYPSLISTCRIDQISWRTVYNLYIKSHQTSSRRWRGHGCRHRLRDRGEGGAGIGEVKDWMDPIEEQLCVFLLFSQTWERVRTRWRVVGGSSLPTKGGIVCI
jgi:hypothetical protein